MSDTPVEAPGPNATAAEANAAVANAASAIGASVAGVAQIIALAERDPCNYEARLFDRLRVAQANLDAMITGVRVWSAKNQAAVERSISTWGKDPLGDDLGGSVPFAAYLVNNGYIDLFWLGFVTSRLPNGAGDNEPSRVDSGSYFIGGPIDGYLGRPGAYVSSRGEIRGSGINEAWHNWTQLQRENVWAASTFRPNWRERLEAWTGRRDWKPGNKFRSGYTVATAIQRVNELENQFDSIAARCEELLATQLELAEQESERASAWVQGQIDAARQQTQVQADAAELASIEELDRQKTIRTVGVAAALGLAAVVAFSMKRFSDTDFVIAASVNVLTLRAIAAGVGAPGWAGAMVAAAAMAIAGDETVDPQLRKIAGALSAPGAVTVQILKDNSELTAPCCSPCADGEPCDA